MKIYCGIPERDGKPPEVVVIGNDGKARPLASGVQAFSWKGKADPGAHALARAVLVDALGPAGAAFATRWRWREVVKWKPERPWSVTVEEIQRSVADMERIEQASAGDRTRIALMPPLVDSETGIGVGGRMIEVTAGMDQSSQYRRNPNITRST